MLFRSSEFSNAILDKLAEQRKPKGQKHALDNADGVVASISQRPSVKVTTVKLLAQLLREADYVSEKFAVDVLSTLSKTASHVDVKLAILNSLLEMLKTSNSDLTESIFTSLEEMVPLIGTLNERRPLTEADWAAARDGRPPPEIELDDHGDAPMLRLLLTFLVTIPMPLYKEAFINRPQQREAFVNRVILPVAASLKKDMEKWLASFLAYVEAPASLIECLPVVGLNFDVWQKVLVTNLQYTPQDVLDRRASCRERVSRLV